MTATVKMASKHRIGIIARIIWLSSITTVFIEALVVQTYGLPLLVFAAVQVDVGSQEEIEALRVETLIDHVRQKSQLLS